MVQWFTYSCYLCAFQAREPFADAAAIEQVAYSASSRAEHWAALRNYFAAPYIVLQEQRSLTSDWQPLMGELKAPGARQ
jgi:hypothetical protein